MGKPLPPEPPRLSRFASTVYVWLSWPWSVRMLKRAGFRRVGWMTWETGPELRAEITEQILTLDESYGMEQVVVPPPLQVPLRDWLTSRGLYLFPIPVEDDLPTFGIGTIRGPEVTRG